MKKLSEPGSRFSIGRVPSSGVEDVDLMALRKHIQELQADNDDLLSHRAGDKGLQMDTLLNL